MPDKKPFTDLELQTALSEADGNLSVAANILGVHRATVRKYKDESLAVSRYVVTNAVNNTRVNEPFWKSLRNYCQENDAELIVIPSRYKNPSAMKMDEPLWYDANVVPFICEEERILNAQVLVMGDVPIQPTAADPLSGLEPHSRGKWAVFGHPQVEMRMIPASMDSVPPMLHTSGSVCEKNYSSSKTGKKAHLHHTFGAVVIECEGDKAHLRQIIGDDTGEFYDVAGGARKYTPKGVEAVESVPALVTGDEHHAVMSDRVLAATYTRTDSIVKTLNPREIYRHDVLDFFSRNHHHADPFQNFVKHLEGSDDVRAEVDACLKFIEETTPEGAVSYLVGSNHNEALGRWLRESNPKIDPKNARFFHELSSIVYKLAEENKTHKIDPFAAYAESIGISDKVKFLGRNEGRTVEGVEVSHHGDKGTNGARGSLATFSRAGFKSVIGHSHSPGIKKGTVQVGHSTDGTDYQSGLTSWFNAHCVIYPNGKRQLLGVLSDGTWRAND